MVIGIGYIVFYFIIGVGIIVIRSFTGSSLGEARDLVPRVFSWYTIGAILILVGFASIIDRKEEKERKKHNEELIDSYRYKNDWEKRLIQTFILILLIISTQTPPSFSHLRAKSGKQGKIHKNGLTILNLSFMS